MDRMSQANRKRIKLCYVLPEVDVTTDSHYYHLYEFLEHVGRKISLTVIAERSPKNIHIKNARVQRVSQVPLFRGPHLFLILLAKRFLGCKQFYIHYSTTAAILCSLITRIFGGTTYYWNCGMVWELHETGLRYVQHRLPFYLTLRLVTYLVTGTKTMADGYAKHYGIPRRKVLVIPNYINLNRFRSSATKIQLRKKLGMPVQKKIVLFVHRLAPRKGAHHLPQIIKEVTKRAHNAHFYIVGKGPYEQQLQKELNIMNLIKHTTLTGAIPNAKIPELMHASDVFIMPSEEEGFPRVLLEAMASGLPFVATDVGGVRDILTKLQKEKCLVLKEDVRRFGERTISLLKKNNDNLIEEGKKHVQQFSLTQIEKVFLNIIRADMRK